MLWQMWGLCCGQKSAFHALLPGLLHIVLWQACTALTSPALCCLYYCCSSAAAAWRQCSPEQARDC
jgi:hypothetical protein